MSKEVKSLRAFIGARDYERSRAFYRDLGFEERVIAPNMSLFVLGSTSFYLQDYYVKDWVENTMVLLEVADVEAYWTQLQQLDLDKKYEGIKLIPVQQHDWGRECMLIDPSGVLWHFAQFA